MPKQKIVDLLRPRLSEFRQQFGNRRLSIPVIAFEVFSMDLSVRTYNCLRGLGVRENADLAELTINDLLRTRNFGVLSLVDLLGAVEAARPVVLGDVEEPEPADDLDGELKATDVALFRAAQSNRLTKELLGKRLPAPPSAFLFDRTALSARLIKRLDKLGVLEDPSGLGAFTLLDLMQIKGFGRKSAIELVTYLEPYLPGRSGLPDQDVMAGREEAIDRLHELLGGGRVLANDQRFGRLLQTALPGANDTSDLRTENTLGIQPAVAGLDALKCSLARAQHLTLDREIGEIIGSIVNARTSAMFCSKYGFQGGLELTLEETGHLFGVTRQRIEQACSKVNDRLFAGNYTPVLGKCLKYIEQHVPDTAEEIEKGLQGASLIPQNFRLNSVVSFARLCHRQINFDLSDFAAKTVVTGLGLGKSVLEIVRFARKLARRNGAARIGDLLAHFAEDDRFSAEIVVGVVVAQTDFAWLDHSEGWYWFANRKWNRVLNRLDKVFSVTDAVTLQDLRAAVRRHHRMQGISPPMHILKAMCLQDPELRVENEVVLRPKGVLDPTALSHIESEMVAVMRGLGGFASREEFERACRENGIARETFYLYLDNSSAFRKFARGVYGLVGTSPSLAQVQGLVPRVARGQVIQDSGWISGNEVWVVYRLSTGALSSGMLSIPSGFVDIISDVFHLQDGTRIPVWKASICLGRFFVENQASVGDLVALNFDLVSRTIQVDLESASVEKRFMK